MMLYSCVEGYLTDPTSYYAGVTPLDAILRYRGNVIHILTTRRSSRLDDSTHILTDYRFDAIPPSRESILSFMSEHYPELLI